MFLRACWVHVRPRPPEFDPGARPQAHTLVAILAFPDVSEEANVSGTGEMPSGGPAGRAVSIL